MSVAVEFAQPCASDYLIVRLPECPLKFKGNTFTFNLCPLLRAEGTCCYNVEKLNAQTPGDL